MNNVISILKVSRAYVLPVMILPVLLGALGAYVYNDIFHPFLLLLTLIGAASAHLFSNLINDLWDYRNGVDVVASNREVVSTHSGVLAQGTWSEKRFSQLTWCMFAVALACGVILSILTGWWVLLFGALGAFIAYFYVAPPIKFGYRGKGYSEIGILIAFGVLPVMGSFYVQTMQLDYRALLLSLPIGILTTLILFNHHFLHWQTDQESGKRTIVVVWGEKKALRFSRYMAMLAYLTLFLCIALGALPIYSLVALISILPLYRVYRQLQDTNRSEAYLPLMDAALKATMICGAIMCVCLLIEGLI
ncbi:prenyltransferase [Risungbinella massiliensis]|uniref:prenyltransferase n=1 Tax=Risungbinella massiliensis TaxID=1329796 RepID=UPI0005CC4578|nr:prenyltransferase [Risungbinella massiliensis]